MNFPAETLFDAIHGCVDAWADSLGSRIREIVEPAQLSMKQHQELKLAVQTELESLTWCILGRFDNLACSLPRGVLGYDIVARPCASHAEESTPLDPIDIRHEEQDYSAMWNEYIAAKRRNKRKTRGTPDDAT